MKQLRMVLLPVMLTMITVAANCACADQYTDTIEIFRSSPAVQPFFNDSYGYAVFPIVGKGALIAGAAYGEGRVYRQGEVTGTTNLVKVSIGFQAGGQVFSQMIFFQDERAYDEFTGGNFEVGANASAVAVTAGAQAAAGTEGATAGASSGPATGIQAAANYHKGMVVFVHAKGGLMLEVSVGGQKFSFEPVK